MKKSNGKRYHPREFASRAGVTVRALHYYDRLALLSPSEHTAAGFRVYRDGDFVRLQQIVTLKFIGFSLKEIKRLLDRKGSDLPAALRAQRLTLEKKRRHLDSAIQAIASAEGVAASASRMDWETFQKITEEIQMQTNHDWTKRYYNEEAQKHIASRAGMWNPELQEKATADWSALFKDIEAAAAEGIDPSSERAQALGRRHASLVEGFTGGNAAVAEGLKKLWEDKENWPEELKQVMEQSSRAPGEGKAAGSAWSMSKRAEAFFQQVCQLRQEKA